jgi:hypothetical protein
MAAQHDLREYFESYLNYSEKSDVNLVNQINNEANRVIDNYYNNNDEEGLRLYLITYIDELRHTMFDNHNRPSWAVRPGQPLMPYYPPMNIPPLPPRVPPLDRGQGYLYKSRKRRPRRGKRARARRSKKYTN